MRFDYTLGYEGNAAFRKEIHHNQLTTYSDHQALTVVGFWGKSKKPSFNYRFKSSDQLSSFIAQKAQSAASLVSYKEERKRQRASAKNKLKEAIKPGVILYDTWGYEQTNVEFYKVLEVKGQKVLIQELGHKQVGEASSWASCSVVADEESTQGAPEWRTIGSYGVKINDSVCLGIWDGKPTYKSWYY